MKVELIEWQSLHAAPATAPNALTGLFADDIPGATSAVWRDRLSIGECRHGLRLRARQHVGVVQLGPLRVSIRPKMAVRELWGVVRYAYGFDGIERSAPVNLDMSGTVVDLLCQLLLDEVEQLWRRGIGRSYQARHDWLAAPRGRPSLAALARSGPLVRAELPCDYHHFSTDIADNRLVGASLQRARQLATVPRLVARLTRAEQRAELFARRVPLSRDLLADCERHASRLNAQYRAIRLLSALLLDGGGGDEAHASGPDRVPGFLWNMALVFERFVTRFLKEYAIEFAVSSQTPLSRLFRIEAGGPCLSAVPTPRPDLIATNPTTGRVHGIFDMKYRDLWGTSVPRDILYQLSTYALASGADAPAIVLYPAISGQRPDMSLAIDVVDGRRRRIIFRAVDWARAARAIASQDVRLAQRLAHQWVAGEQAVATRVR